jgi:diguanylate cyclase (GGDEF)-like protein/PAS domain S-box-containing protein
MEAVLAATTEQALIATDRHGRIIVFNAGAERMLGYTAEQALGRDVAGLLHQPDELARRADTLGVPVDSVVAFRAQNGTADTQHWTYRRHDGSALTVALSVTALRHPAGELQGYLGVAVDVTAQQQREQQLHQAAEHAAYRAAHDPLTGLPNRVVLIDRLQHTLATQRRQSQPAGGLLYLDVDGLKTINDLHGHAAGDALLVGVARRLAAACREGDLCARLGGDEFAVLLENVHDAAELDTASDRIRQHLAEPLPLDADADAVPTASIGGTLLRSTDTPEAALARADRHMYTHKTAHRTRRPQTDP